MGAVRRQISRHASTLRRERTDAEDRVWQWIRNRQIGGFKWRFQHTIGDRVADFVCLDAMLIVEIDGSQHDEQVDRQRTAELEACGFAIIRFWNSDVFENLDGVLEAILAAARHRAFIRRSPVSCEVKGRYAAQRRSGTVQHAD